MRVVSVRPTDVSLAIAASRDAEVSLDNYAAGFFASSDCPARLCVDVASGCGRDIILKVCAQTDVKVAQYEHDGDVLMWSDHSMPLIHSSRPLLHVSTTAPTFKSPVCTGPYSLIITW